LAGIERADTSASSTEYREEAEAGQLRRIAPRRFNADGEAWLAMLHNRRGSRRYTAL
jgi:hypothetical protein